MTYSELAAIYGEDLDMDWRDYADLPIELLLADAASGQE